MERTFSLCLPWINRRRPFAALHVTFWGHRCQDGRSWKIYHIGLQLGRLFMPNLSNGWSYWFDVGIPERQRR